MLAKQSSLILLTPGFPENETDSTCLPWFQCFVRQLKDSYPDLKIIVVSLQYPFQKKEYQWEGIRVNAMGGRNSSGIAKRLLRYKVHQQLKDYVKRNPSLVLSVFGMEKPPGLLKEYRQSISFLIFAGLPDRMQGPGTLFLPN
ncbi:MAG: hypothetical protein IPG86_08260 [Chitinophagaceae bacterium]|nr:hypothetical protein [Chitinophagaceae bacterium]